MWLHLVGSEKLQYIEWLNTDKQVFKTAASDCLWSFFLKLQFLKSGELPIVTDEKELLFFWLVLIFMKACLTVP